MTKISLLITITACSFLLFSCEKKPVESNNNQATLDSTNNKETANQEVAVAPEIELTGNAKLIAKKWKATEIEMPSVKLPGDLVNIQFDFKKDGTFDYQEDNTKDTGKWKMSEDGKMLMLEYDNKIKADLNVKELKDTKFVIAGKEHGMYRTYILAPL
jgi:hypothetical protein